MKIVFTFPGQGTQHEGMLQNLPGTELAQAREVLGTEVDTLDSADALSHTRAVQLCLLIAGVAWRASWNGAAWRRISSAGCPSALIRRRSLQARWTSRMR